MKKTPLTPDEAPPDPIVKQAKRAVVRRGVARDRRGDGQIRPRAGPAQDAEGLTGSSGTGGGAGRISQGAAEDLPRPHARSSGVRACLAVVLIAAVAGALAAESRSGLIL